MMNNYASHQTVDGMTYSTTMEPCVAWEFPSPPIGDPAYRDVTIEKPCVVGAQPTDDYLNYRASRSPRGYPNLIVIFRFRDWECLLHTTSWIYTMTVSIHSRFQTVVKCVHLKVFLHVVVWRGRALLTFVRHCDVIAHTQRRALRGRRCWLVASDGGLTGDCSATKITWFWLLRPRWSCKNEDWPPFCARSREWTRHHALGATGDPTSAWWRVHPRLLTQKRGQFLHPYPKLDQHMLMIWPQIAT